MKKLLSTLLLGLIAPATFAQYGDCGTSDNICSDANYSVTPSGYGTVEEFTWSSNVSNPSSNPNCCNSGCLLSGELNSTWMTITVSGAGVLEFSFGTPGTWNCYDWIMWPYDPTSTCTDIQNNVLSPVACNWNGWCDGFTGMANTLPAGGMWDNFEQGLNVSVGDQFIICLSNYSSASTQVPLNFFGSASVSCSPVFVNDETACEGSCVNLTANGGITYTWNASPDLSATTGANVTACPPGPGTYDYIVTGTIPSGTASDTATVTILPTSDPACTTPTCAIVSISTNHTVNCDDYSTSGDVAFSTPPVGGTLIVEDCNGNQDVLSPPFTSPMTYNITGQLGDGNPCSITAYFSTDPTCTFTENYTAPFTQSDEAGTVTASISGYGNNQYILCDQDMLNIVSDGNSSIPPIGPGNDPGLAWFVYTCPPAAGGIGIDPTTDPCYVTSIGGPTDLSLQNQGGSADPFLQTLTGLSADQTFYLVPMTQGSHSAGVWQTDCYDLALDQMVTVQYLNPIQYVEATDCYAGTSSITVTGGYGEFYAGTQYTASNLTPATASFNVSTITHGGTIEIAGLVTGDMYSFDLTDGNGCKLTLNLGPFTGSEDPSFGYDAASYCLTGTDPVITLTGFTPGAFSYTAQNGGTLGLDPVTGDISLAASTADIYQVTYTTGGPCPADSTVQVIVSANPTAGFQYSSFNYCANESDPTPTMDVGASIGTFSSSVGLVLDANTGLVDLDASTPGSYTIANDVSLAGCAPVQSTFAIDIFEVPSATLSGGGTICQGQLVPTVDMTLTGNGPWQVDVDLDGVVFTETILNASDTLVSAGTAGTYTIMAVQDVNCANGPVNGSAVIQIDVVPQITAPSDISLCEGAYGSGVIMDNPQLNPDGATLNWTSPTDMGFGTSGQGNIPPYTATSTGGTSLSDVVTITPMLGSCIGTPVSFNMYIEGTPTAGFSANVLAGCAPLTVRFANESTPGWSSNIWNFGDGAHVVDNSDTVVHTYQGEGCFNVSLTTVSPNGCNAGLTQINYICVSPQPEALFNYSPSNGTIGHSGIQFTDLSTGGNQITWTFGDHSGSSNESDPYHYFPDDQPGSYLVRLVVTNDQGCTDSTSTLISVLDELIFFVPNAFTPDDDAHNEVFLPRMTAGFDIYRYVLTIYDRWGETVFQSLDPSIGWDGTYTSSGIEAKQGVYVWTIELMDSVTDEKKQYSGHVTLLR